MALKLFNNIRESLLNLAFPHVCEGCGNEVINKEHFLCLQCFSNLPDTKFESFPGNPLEKIFHGRLDIVSGSATYYFRKNSMMQQLIHQFKYRNHIRLGNYLGRLMGRNLESAGRFSNVDALVPLPLFRAREKQRGFNQATILCNGISEVFRKPILKDVVIRNEPTESQTKKTRIGRWQNMKDRFEVTDQESLKGKHILLVDDVLTTGATMEACGAVLSGVKNVQLSMASLCFSIEG
ncbi:MAG TPA: phosphoribosyltransferase family protein [Flavisolibacter sp.]|nr:phosphoribosyltransferase family protein [Flavisolibacter sp.]